jgi:hypothetical protein
VVVGGIVSLRVRVCVCVGVGVDVGMGVGVVDVVAVGDRCCKIQQIKTCLWQRGWVHHSPLHFSSSPAIVCGCFIRVVAVALRLCHSDVRQHLGDEITKQK